MSTSCAAIHVAEGTVRAVTPLKTSRGTVLVVSLEETLVPVRYLLDPQWPMPLPVKGQRIAITYVPVIFDRLVNARVIRVKAVTR